VSLIIATEDHVKTYQQVRKPLTVLNGVNLRVVEGEFTALSAHGSVKSTGNPR